MKESYKFSLGGVCMAWNFFRTIHSLITLGNETKKKFVWIFLYSLQIRKSGTNKIPHSYVFYESVSVKLPTSRISFRNLSYFGYIPGNLLPCIWFSFVTFCWTISLRVMFGWLPELTVAEKKISFARTQYTYPGWSEKYSFWNW